MVWKINSLLGELSKFTKVEQLKYQLQNLKHFNSQNEILICLSKDQNDSLIYSLITKHSKTIDDLDSIPNHSIESVVSKEKTIHKITIDKQYIYTTLNDSIFFGSNRLSIVEASSIKTKKEKALEKIYKTANSKSTLSILINTKNNNFVPYFFDNDLLNQSQFTNYLLLETNISQDEILVNGITKAVDSTKSLINIFKHSRPQENQIARVSPSDVDQLLSITFNDFQTFNEQLHKFNGIDSVSSDSNIFDNIIEAGLVSKQNNKALFLYSIDANSTKESLASETIVETFRDVIIYEFETPQRFQNTLSPLIQFDSGSKYIVINESFVFSDSIDFLKNIISDIQNNSVLAESNHYQNIMLNLSDESSLFLYGNASHLNQILNSNFSETQDLKLNSYKASAIQFIYDTDFAHVNGIVKKHKARAASNSVSEDLNIVLDADLLSAPQVVNNHLTNQKDIAVQDVNNNLYLISNQGKIYWKKQLHGKIIGHIEQIDMYKNGRLQLAFATPNRVYVLDRNGKDVPPFPLKFNDQITQPLSVFDYDKKKNYRLLVTQNNSLLMYDAKGKIVTGFTYSKAKNTITTQPKHFRIGRKDYIVFGQGTTLEILDRLGKTRVKVNEAVHFSDNAIYLYKNKFTTTDTQGNLIQINEKGQMSTSKLNLSETHHIDTTSKTLVSLSDNQLTIKSRTVELDFGEYTPPKIFYVNDKIYVSTTDLQAKKIYLFDSQAKSNCQFSSVWEFNNRTWQCR